MAKNYGEPNSKLDDIHDNVYAELLNAGIINKKKEILNEETFAQYINAKIKKLEPLFDAVEKDGVVTDQYRYNLLNTELEYLKQILEQKTLTPASASPYPAPDTIKEYMTNREHKTQANVQRKGFFSKLFGRNK